MIDENMKNVSIAVQSFILLFGAFLLPATVFAAPSIQYSPTTQTVVQNTNFTVTINVNAESNQIIGNDVVVSYAGADLDVVSVSSGNFFPEFHYADNGSGRLELHGYVTSIYQAKTGSGALATITFKGTKPSGSSALSFTCNGSGNDTNMLNTNGQNILSCNSVNQVALTYSGSGSSTNTPTPTNIPGATFTPTPTSLPGNSTPTCTSIAANMTNTQGTPAPITFTCSGKDSDGYVNAVEFTFGDGTKQVVEKNIGGQGGSISTTHTYTSIGTFGASCRVRDNNSVYSSVPSGCQQSVVVRPNPTTTQRQSTTGGTGTNTTTTVATTPYYPGTTTSIEPTTSPTVAVVSIISVTPLPTLGSQITPTLYPPEQATTTSSSRMWWIIGGAVSLLLAFLLLRRKKKKEPPQAPPTTMPPIIVQEVQPPMANPS